MSDSVGRARTAQAFGGQSHAGTLAAALSLAVSAGGVAGLAPVTWAQTRLETTARSSAPAAADEATKKLESQQSELAAKEARDKELQKDLESIATERRELKARLVDTAALVQQGEAQMTALEQNLAGLEAKEQQARAALSKEHVKIATLLAALQRMGRNPPPVIVTRREDALKMVRSAIMIATAFPELREEAQDLTKKLNELLAIKDDIRKKSDALRAESDRLNTTRTQLAALLETKKQSEAERQAELRQVRVAAAQIAENVKDLSELITKLSQQATQTPPVADVEQGRPASGAPMPDGRETVAALPPTPSGEPAALAPGAIPSAVAHGDRDLTAPAGTKTEEVAMLTPPMAHDTPSSVVELAPAASMVSPGSADRMIRPAVAFASAKGRLHLPAQGRRVLGFGDKTQHGGTSKGVVIETRFGARVTSPSDGWVVYAGEFRSYGQLLIINAGGGYYVLVAGMSQMDVGPGQFVLAGEPIGTMNGAPRTAQLAADKTGSDQTAPQSSAPVLYVEFRKDGQPVNSDPWWAGSHEKVQE